MTRNKEGSQGKPDRGFTEKFINKNIKHEYIHSDLRAFPSVSQGPYHETHNFFFKESKTH